MGSGGGTSTGGSTSGTGGSAAAEGTLEGLITACVAACDTRYAICENSTGLTCREICETWKSSEPAGCYGTGTAHMNCIATQAPDCDNDWAEGTECDGLDYSLCLFTKGEACGRHELWDIQCDEGTFAHRCRPTATIPAGCTKKEMQEDANVYCCTSEL